MLDVWYRRQYENPESFAYLRAGIDVATVNPSLFFQMFKHPLTDAGLAQFVNDWKRVRK